MIIMYGMDNPESLQVEVLLDTVLRISDHNNTIRLNVDSFIEFCKQYSGLSTKKPQYKLDLIEEKGSHVVLKCILNTGVVNFRMYRVTWKWLCHEILDYARVLYH